MKTIVFHYYDGAFSTNPIANKVQPIIFAISAARRQNPHCEIVVFESSTQKQDWGKFPDLLQFKVLKAKEMDVFNFGLPVCDSRSMGKLWDVAETEFKFPNIAVYSSIYIPIHADQNYLYMDRLYLGSEGCFSFNRKSERAMFTLDGWRGMCLLFAQSKEFRSGVIKFTKGQLVTEYTLAQYMAANNLYQTHCLDPMSCMPMSVLLQEQASCSGVILNNDFCGHDRVRVIAGFKELRDAVNWNLLVELIPSLKEVKTNNFSIADLWINSKLTDIQNWFGSGFRKPSDKFWDVERNNDWRHFNRDNALVI
jgi:hypothetical protein